MKSDIHLKHEQFRRDGIPEGYTQILGLDDIVRDVEMEFGILRLASGQELRGQEESLETQFVVLHGKGTIELDGKSYAVERHDLFRQNAWAFDFPRNTAYALRADAAGLEVAIIKAVNEKHFQPAVLAPKDIPYEQRGQGKAGDTMHRVVKAIFGDPNAPIRSPESNLVVGEVINFQGRWSSYPPHYHKHNEVYYYRFEQDKPDAFGVSVMNEKAYVVHEHDVIKIMNCVGHSQVAPPGYAMWYLWFIRQIEGKRYEGNPPFTYFAEHAWVNDDDADEKILRPEET